MDKKVDDRIIEEQGTICWEIANKRRQETIGSSQSDPDQNKLVTLRSAVKLNLELLEQQTQGLNTDIVLNCRDGFFEIHSCILMISSPVFFKFRHNFQCANTLDGETLSPPRFYDVDLTQFGLRDVATVLFLFYTGKTMINMPGMCSNFSTSEGQRKIVLGILENLGAIPAEVQAGLPLEYDKYLVGRQLINFHGRYLRFGVHASPADCHFDRCSAAKYYLISVEGSILSVPGSKIEKNNHNTTESNISKLVLESADFKSPENSGFSHDFAEKLISSEFPAYSTISQFEIRSTKDKFESNKLDCSLQRKHVASCSNIGNNVLICKNQNSSTWSTDEQTKTYRLQLIEQHIRGIRMSFSDNIIHPDGRHTEKQELRQRLRACSPMKSRCINASTEASSSSRLKSNNNNSLASLTNLVQPVQRNSAATTCAVSLRAVLPKITGPSKRPSRITALQAQASLRSIIELFPDKPLKKHKRRSVRRTAFMEN
ncbi:unnamed protein product [Allacma fusca]|uniref:BTB domain-containing protein n=1 Tax=Allacma fusca TaxID=39272 RepID=A0A8J2JM59_9HEXA|nr:unnamed protein product [Allacma fusca]